MPSMVIPLGNGFILLLGSEWAALRGSPCRASALRILSSVRDNSSNVAFCSVTWKEFKIGTLSNFLEDFIDNNLGRVQHLLMSKPEGFDSVFEEVGIPGGVISLGLRMGSAVNFNDQPLAPAVIIGDVPEEDN